MRIYLIGLPGVGKTRIGKLLANKLNLNFYDTDELIENNNEKHPKDIINQNGEAYFRYLETNTLKDLLIVDGIVSCGGGIVEISENRRYLDGLVVYLKVDPKDLTFEKEEIEKRPILQKDGIQKLYDKRKTKYKVFSNLIIDISNKSDLEIIQEVIEHYENINN